MAARSAQAGSTLRRVIFWTWEDREKTIEYYSDIFDMSDEDEALTYPDLVCGEGRIAMPNPMNTNIRDYAAKHVTFTELHQDQDAW